MSEIKNESGLFTVTPMDPDNVTIERDEMDNGDLYKFRKNAENDGYPQTVIERAAERACTESCNTYRDFEELIDSIITEEESSAMEREERDARIRRSVKLEISRLEKIEDIAQYADSQIYNVYSTHSVTLMDLLRWASEEQLDLGIYQEPVYSIIIQMNKPWVAEIVDAVKNSWKTMKYPKDFVNEYLESEGVPEQEWEQYKAKLPEYLSIEYRNDTAPDEYKQFKAVQQILHKNDPNSFIDSYINDEDNMLEYGAALQAELEDGTPSEIAMLQATEDAIGSPMSVAEKAGVLYGKMVGFKYRTAKNFEDMMYESMGEYAPAYKEKHEQVKARKEQIKAQKEKERANRAQLREERKIAEAQAKASQSESRVYNEDIYPYEDHTRNTRTEHDRERHRDRVPNERDSVNQYVRQSPSKSATSDVVRNVTSSTAKTMAVLVLVHIVLALIAFALMSKAMSLFAVIGLVLALVGIVQIKSQIKNGFLLTLGGYGLYIGTIYLSILF